MVRGDSVATQQVLRPKQHDRIRIVQFTDTHLHADPGWELYGINTDRSLRHVLATARERSPAPDLVLLTGDLVHDGSSDGYRRLAYHVGQLGTTGYSLAGNHDVPDTMARLYRGPPVDYRDSLAIGGWLLVFLNSHLPRSDAGELGEEQISRLESRLAGDDQRHVLLCVHHHPVPVGSPWIDSIGLRDAARLWQALRPHRRVRGILWGHIHQDYTGEKNGVRLLGSPSTCVQFAPRCDSFSVDEAPPAYRWLELGGEGSIRTGIVHCPLPENQG